MPKKHAHVVLCRPGGALVAEGIPEVDAHIDLHFRLGHHDLLADIIDAVQMFQYEGGIAGLDARSKVSLGYFPPRTSTQVTACKPLPTWSNTAYEGTIP